MDIAAFLAARLDEDEALAREADAEPFPETGHERGTHIAYGLESTGIGLQYQAFALAWDPARVLAEVAAKRRILNEYRMAQTADPIAAANDTEAVMLVGVRETLLAVLHVLAASYADHPDFKPEWRIDGT